MTGLPGTMMYYAYEGDKYLCRVLDVYEREQRAKILLQDVERVKNKREKEYRVTASAVFEVDFCELSPTC